MISAYVHDWNPVLFEIVGPLAIRWYGLAYLLSFFLGFILLKHLATRKLWVLPPDEVSDFIAMCAMFGVFLGGRLGYVIFYMIPDKGIQYILNDPLTIVRVWDGGMASHGGILGLILYTLYYARKKGVSWTGVGDGLCVVAPIGIFCVRMANFINGELYGRIDPSCKWSIKFPATLFDPKAPEHAHYNEALSEAHNLQPLSQTSFPSPEYLKSVLRAFPEYHTSLEQLLQPRHPSQLYEGLLEGLLLFLILFFIRIKKPQLGNGVITGLFFILYASGRIFAEQFREPDSALVGVLTKGQFYSVFMIIIGLFFFSIGLSKQKRNKLI